MHMHIYKLSAICHDMSHDRFLKASYFIHNQVILLMGLCYSLFLMFYDFIACGIWQEARQGSVNISIVLSFMRRRFSTDEAA